MLAPVPLQVELSPTAVAATGTSPPARRRSSVSQHGVSLLLCSLLMFCNGCLVLQNSALDLRPLSRLHPTKFGKEGDEEGGDEEAEGHSVAGGGYGENGEGYCSGESSDGDGVFEEKERAGGGNMSAPGTASAPAAAIATFSPSSRAAAPAGTAATPVLVLTPPSAKVPPAAAAAPASITAPEPAAAPADRDDRLQDSAGTGTGGNSWSNNKTNNTNNLVPPKTGHYSYENENQHSGRSCARCTFIHHCFTFLTELFCMSIPFSTDPDSSADGSLVVSASSSTFSSSATLTTSASATSSYESKKPFSVSSAISPLSIHCHPIMCAIAFDV